MPGTARTDDSRRLSARNQKIARAVVSVAQEIGCSPAQVAIRWIMQQPGIQIPILGARTRDQLEENLGAIEVFPKLDDAVVERIEGCFSNVIGLSLPLMRRWLSEPSAPTGAVPEDGG